jgi:hypothetical protein
MPTMTTKRKSPINRVAFLPEGLLDEVEESLGGNGDLHEGGVYSAPPEELKAIDEARGQIRRGEVATDEEVEAAFAKFRGA